MRRKTIIRYVILGIILLVGALTRNVPADIPAIRTPSASPTLHPTGTSATVSGDLRHGGAAATVVQVVDGDTIKISTGETVRYIGIDTPETKDPRRPVQCYGKEAAEKNTELVMGKTVELEKDVSDKDKYGRLLRYVWVSDTLVNEVLVSEGYAHASRYPPDVKYQGLFREAEASARNNQKGLWGDACNLTPTP